MRIGFNASLLSSPSLRGWNRYAVNLISELATLDYDLFLYAKDTIHEDHLKRIKKGRIQIRVHPTPSHFSWEQRWLPDQAKRDKVHILHSPFNYGLPFRTHCPKILTLHDAIETIYYGPKRSLTEKYNWASFTSGFYHWVARTSADRIITVSEHSKADLITHLKIAPAKIEVIYEASDAQFHTADENPVEAAANRPHPSPYFFYVGGWEERKNIPFLLRAFSESKLGETQLVLAGGAETDRPRVEQSVSELGLMSRVKLLGWVSEIELRTWYANALAFVYPSSYEGFGLQLCEAMASGCPTLAARASCLPEVLGAGGEIFSLDSTAELKALLEKLNDQIDFRAELRARAKKRSLDFSWHKTAQKTAALYESLVEDPDSD